MNPTAATSSCSPVGRGREAVWAESGTMLPQLVGCNIQRQLMALNDFRIAAAAEAIPDQSADSLELSSALSTPRRLQLVGSEPGCSRD
jgi:hypothetical protein